MPKNVSKPKLRKKGRAAKPKEIPSIIRIRKYEEMAAWTGYAELMKLQARIPDEGTWHALTCRLNIGSCLAMHFPEIDYATPIGAGLNACIKIRDRHLRTSIYVAGDPEIEDIRVALNMTEQMQAQVSNKQMIEAIDYVMTHAAQR